MAKSMRSKREKRLRAIRREMVEPIYDKKDAAKLAAQQAALAAPKLPVRPSPFTNISTMDVAPASTSTAADAAMEVEMDDGSESMMALKAVGGIGKKSKKKFKVGKAKRRGKCKIKRNRHI
ncbi:hypothetical protein SDJN02_10379 [Cucurbita argyrosperma subsp. argyrosperma]|uniref:Uncharacterized protein LOC111497220 n=2 Tax=Cucurbita TaxID=3660 RepID=A0A6J1KND1_CUCMA|nr:uncharacterized protein LOC111433923 [Cucurbita moschata]XP_023003712.1 uncharacterized protein LOC111497220 [Cucurbita maxima]XP_023517951.1 uncharacterized protein LOC111781531 [Cucurbita pepo subsp. pepo]KAG7026380.1 hypothetical protein SDJN02_10379 [Cucurbita argyrosperma subsp. argyrosperma]